MGYGREVIWFLVVMALMKCPEAVEGASIGPCARLAETRSFSFFAEVAAGTPISGEAAFAQVLHRPDRVDCLTKVVANGTNEARMYALAALRELSPTQYRYAVTNLGRRRFSVTTLATEQQGILRTETSKSVISQIESGKYRRIVEFWCKHELTPQRAAEDIERNQLEKMRARLRQALDNPPAR